METDHVTWRTFTSSLSSVKMFLSMKLWKGTTYRSVTSRIIKRKTKSLTLIWNNSPLSSVWKCSKQPEQIQDKLFLPWADSLLTYFNKKPTPLIKPHVSSAICSSSTCVLWHFWKRNHSRDNLSVHFQEKKNPQLKLVWSKQCSRSWLRGCMPRCGDAQEETIHFLQ